MRRSLHSQAMPVRFLDPRNKGAGARRCFQRILLPDQHLSRVSVILFMINSTRDGEDTYIVKNTFKKRALQPNIFMVVLLGRAISLNQSLEFVLDMPKKPNSDVWAALLSSCRLHGDVEIANIAAKELLKLDSVYHLGAYVALSNTLEAAERWDITEIREVMKASGISKHTGFSWIETYGNLLGFHAGQNIRSNMCKEEVKKTIPIVVSLE